jgi:hypothetical protein
LPHCGKTLAAGVINMHVQSHLEVFGRNMADIDTMMRKNPARLLGLI